MLASAPEMTLDPPVAVTFDFGQTLCDIDTEMLARRLAERGVRAAPGDLEQAVDGAWRAYDAAIHAGFGGHPWKILMRELLSRAGVAGDALGDAVDWLWTEQPRQNLWRRPIPGMLELVLDLRRAGIAIGVISNSEGRLAELIDEIGWFSHFDAVADSGVLGMEKPGPEIFAWTAERLGAPLARIVHVGDSYAADVEGALGAGMRAVWFRPRALPQGTTSTAAARAPDAAAARAALAALGLLGGSAV